MNPFIIVLIAAGIVNGLNVWYMIRSRHKHNQCVNNRKSKKK